jgi:hypothetical protein
MKEPDMDAFRQWDGSRSIELGRGNTLKLEDPAGATVRLVDGSAWLSAHHSSHRMPAGKAIPVSGNGATLIYAFEHASLCLEASEHCSIELRRRGEVAAVMLSEQRDDPEELRKAIEAVGPRIGDVRRYLFVALVRRHPRDERS